MTLRFTALLAVLATPALAETQVSSQIKGLAIVAADTLPPAPGGQEEVEFCTHLFAPDITTAAGREVQAKGWIVTTELPFGELTAVSFIGSASPATSGTCALQDGNVGFFAGDRLVALLYATDSGAELIGSVRPFGDSGLRVLSGDLVPTPVADLQRDGTGIAVTPLAAEDPVCSGAASVPNVYLMPIDKARERLIAAGWTPASDGPEDCSGTGFGFCSYRFTNSVAGLSVITAGEGGEDGSQPPVVRYAAECQ
jgi:hypothetical protein